MILLVALKSASIRRIALSFVTNMFPSIFFNITESPETTVLAGLHVRVLPKLGLRGNAQ
jgi:hypothetical protein